MQTHSGVSVQKQAIDVHSERAGSFAESYDDMTRDPHASCFAYSRKRLAPLLTRYLAERGEGKSKERDEGECRVLGMAGSASDQGQGALSGQATDTHPFPSHRPRRR